MTDPAAPTAPAGPQAQFDQALRAGRFLIQRCDSCARPVFPPRRLCPACGGAALSWLQPGGGGTVHATTEVARPAQHGGPYGVVLVDLDEGVRLMSRVDGIAPQDVRIGMRVSARTLGSGSEAVLVFVAAGGR